VKANQSLETLAS